MLNPAFNINHMREMTPVFYDVSHKARQLLALAACEAGHLADHRVAFQLRMGIEATVREGPQEVNLINWMGRTALELVGQGTLGYSFDPLTADSRDEYAEAVKAFM